MAFQDWWDYTARSVVASLNGSDMNETQVIDTQALERLKEWGGDKLAGQMVRLFLKNSGVRMNQIRSGVANSDPDEVERGAHSLKSSAANIGAEELRSLTTQIESAALERDVDTMRSELPDLEAAYDAAMNELQVIEKEMPADEP